MSTMNGKVALVTGGARGIGQETAVELARRGAKVAIADRKLELAQETAELCKEESGQDAHAFLVDQSKPEEVESCVAAIIEHFGRIDLLFANAGTGMFAPLVEMAKKDWNKIVQVNLNGTFYFCQEVALRMMAQGEGGKIVLTASSGAEVIADQLGAYCVTKAGVIMLMKHLASELGNYRINVNAIMPGVIETAITAEKMKTSGTRNMLIRQTPVGRWGTPMDVAKLVAFLLSDDASYINGEGVMIDGGSTLHGYPRWYSLDYTEKNKADWHALFDEYPYN
jgi:NAD(P)-dependent dehydrogenase (short-subunit alcohol dehydrogenase family)